MADPNKRTYPDVPRVKDDATAASLRKLWDRMFDHVDQISGLQADLKTAQDTIKSQAATISSMGSKLNRIAATTITTPTAGGGVSPPPPTPTDDGQGAAGCSSAGSTGHITGTPTLDAFTAGQIVCGTANEFPSLLAATANQPARDANVLELLGRMIWHLQQAGFTAGKQKNPSGTISTDKLTVQIAGELRAYDTMSLTSFTVPLTTHMIQVFPANYVADGGIHD